MALGNENSATDFIIFVKIGENIFSQSEFISFSLSISMNTAPTGELILLDRNNIGLSPNDAGNLMLIELNNVNDDKTQKSSSLIVVIVTGTGL